MSNLVVQTSPASLLKDELSRRAQRNPAYSLRAFARDLGVSHTYLSLVMHGKRTLSLRQAYQMAGPLGVPAESLAKAPTKKPKKQLKEKAVQLEIDQFQFVSHWYHIAILDLTLVKDFKSEISWIAKQLAISEKQAGTAVARLERLGLLKFENGRWAKTSEELYVPGTIPVTAIRQYHDQMIRKGLKTLKSKEETSHKKRDITGTTMAIDPTRIPLAKRRIQRFRKELMRFLSQGERTSLYQLNVQLFELANCSEPGGPHETNT